MSIAVCINCGFIKRERPIYRCSNCGFVPTTPEDKAKSVILSTFYQVDGVYRGRSPEELRMVAEAVAAKRFDFDEKEVREVAEYGEAVASISAATLWKDAARMFMPALMFLALLFLFLRYGR